jgi:predicted MPP superfamily phosphohydrolase
MPTVTYLSDIHLEFYDRTLPRGIDMKGGDILCLAGDIGCPESRLYVTFLAYVAPLFKYVFVITGNHEYYKTSTHPLKTIQNINQKLTENCKHFRNVHFLSESSFYIPEYNMNVLGTTLWTGGEADRDDMYQYNDFRMIHDMSLEGYMQRLHETSLLFLKDELQKHKHDGSKVLVLTHHLPSFQLIAPQYKDRGMNHLFATNLDDLFRDYTIHHWICGHSHCHVQKTIENTKVWMNPVGYPRENKDICWNATFEL